MWHSDFLLAFVPKNCWHGAIYRNFQSLLHSCLYCLCCCCNLSWSWPLIFIVGVWPLYLWCNGTLCCYICVLELIWCSNFANCSEPRKSSFLGIAAFLQCFGMCEKFFTNVACHSFFWASLVSTTVRQWVEIISYWRVLINLMWSVLVGQIECCVLHHAEVMLINKLSSAADLDAKKTFSGILFVPCSG